MSFTPIFSFGSAGENIGEINRVVPVQQAVKSTPAEQSIVKFAVYLNKSVDMILTMPPVKAAHEGYSVLWKLLHGKAEGASVQ